MREIKRLFGLGGEKSKNKQDIDEYVNEVLRQAQLVMAVAEQQTLKPTAIEFATKLKSILPALKGLGSSISRTSHRAGFTTKLTMIQLSYPKANEAQVVELFNQADLEFPDQSMWQIATSFVDSVMMEEGFSKVSGVNQIKDESSLVIFEGLDWSDELSEMIGI